MFVNIAIAVILVLALATVVKAEPDLQPLESNRVRSRQALLEPSDDPFAQVNSVSELRDVRSTDWAYQALRELTERYGCMVGYPDRTFRGDRALTRWEFAAGLNACLQQIERLVEQNVSIRREDFEKLQRLARDFETELASLGTRADNLEARVAYLEDNQFSTTTKLRVQTIWSVSDTFGDGVGEDSDESQTQFAYRIRFNVETSFTGEDLLRTRLQVSNFGSIADVTGTNMTRLNYDDNSDNQVQIPHLLYRTPITDNLSLTVGPVGIGYTDITDTLTPPTIADDSLGIPSKFGEYNPLYRRGGGGGALNWNIAKDLVLTVGYLAGDPSNPEEGSGLFNGSYNALAQLAYSGESGAIGIAYSRSYAPDGEVNLTGDTGSFLAREPFGDDIATSSDFVAIQGYYRITPNFQIHGWGGYISATAEGSGVSDIANGVGGTIPLTVSDGDRAELWYGAIGLTFPDVGGEGNLPGILLGLPPQVTSSDVREERDTSYHIEAFYRIKINDNIAITPGFWVIVNPENDSRNDTQWVGHVRTSFNF
jgi:hypothetical protein